MYSEDDEDYTIVLTTINGSTLLGLEGMVRINAAVFHVFVDNLCRKAPALAIEDRNVNGTAECPQPGAIFTHFVAQACDDCNGLNIDKETGL